MVQPVSQRNALTFSHMGFYVRDLERMARFYKDVMCFFETDRGDLGPVQLMFLSRDPTEHHQIVLASGRPTDLAFSVINQIRQNDSHHQLATEHDGSLKGNRALPNCKWIALHGQKNSAWQDRPRSKALLHQQHLARTLDRTVQLALVVSGQPRVLARQDAALIGDELLEQVHILVIKRVHGEVNFGFRTGNPHFRRGPFAAAIFSRTIGVGFAWHK